MHLRGTMHNRETLVLVLLATAVLAAVTYGVVTYQTPYGCSPSGVAQGPSIDWQVLAKPCIYIYFTAIVGGSVLLILLIPVPEKKAGVSSGRKMSLGVVLPAILRTSLLISRPTLVPRRAER